ncbi:MAG: FAD-dependent oxidoreductase [Pseudomonadota bacterium]
MSEDKAKHGPSVNTSEIKVYGRVGSTEGYEIRDFLTRTVVEFNWIDLTCEEDCHQMLGLKHFEDLRFPVVEMPDGERLFAPQLREIADRLGWVTTPRYREYDVSIYGAGPAGLSAAVYAASEGLRTVLIERHAVGGQAGTSSLIENYMGFPKGISGAALAEQARQQAVKFGAELIMMGEGVEATFNDNRIHVRMADGSRMVAKSNICATGVEYRKLGLANEHQFLGNGIFYGAGAAEAPYCHNKEVFVVGGGNSAGQAVMHFADYARKVTMLVRGGSLSETLSDYLIGRINEKRNVEVVTNVEVSAVDGDGVLREITVRNRLDESERKIDTDRLFVCIGGVPNTDWAKDTDIIRDRVGYLITGPDLVDRSALPECWALERQPYYLETSVAGSFAIGDVRHNSIKRVASAVGEGAMAISFVHRYLAETH